MRLKTIGIIALFLCLSSSLALAATINPGAGSETSLWTIINSWLGTSYTQSTLEALATHSSIPAGSYVIDNYVSYASYSQQVGDYNTANSVPLKTAPDLLTAAIHSSSPIAFSQATGNIGFYDYADSYTGAPITTYSNSSTYGAALIFEIPGHGIIVAFEDGNGGHPCKLGDQDYNDLVFHASAVPLPGAVLLLGAGLARLTAYVRRRKED